MFKDSDSAVWTFKGSSFQSARTEKRLDACLPGSTNRVIYMHRTQEIKQQGRYLLPQAPRVKDFTDYVREHRQKDEL